MQPCLEGKAGEAVYVNSANVYNVDLILPGLHCEHSGNNGGSLLFSIAVYEGPFPFHSTKYEVS
jgi:hypothetical protein